VVDVLAEFKNALDQVPLVLLAADDARVLTDARTSVDVLDSLLSSPIAIVLVGSTGVGKSHLVNRIAGMDVAPVGVVRPTTTAVITAGSSGPAAIDRASEYVYVSSMPTGVAVVDTPPWGSDSSAVIAALSNADVGVIVVTPSRYADATSAELWAALQIVPSRVVGLNRMRGTESERSEILASVSEQFDDADVLNLDEMGAEGNLVEELLERAPDHRSRDGEVAIARAAAAQAGRYLAGVVTAISVDLGILAGAVEDAAPSLTLDQGLTVRETWSETERDLVEAIAASVSELDQAIADSADSAVGVRVLRTMDTWQSSDVEDALIDWRTDVVSRFRSNATIRWRKRSTEQMIDRESWKIGVNRSVQVSSRVRRAMRSNLEPITIQSHDLLMSVFRDAVDERRDEWRKIVVEAAAFKPGELFTASRTLEEQ
jgi:hypothetical protein